MKLYPAIDIMDGEVVRLKQGKQSERIGYHADPVAQALEFASHGATHIHVVDLDAAFAQGDNQQLIRRVAEESGLSVQTGGGFKTIDQIDEAFNAGVWRIVIGSAAIENPRLVEEAVRLHGAGVCVGLDAKEGLLRIRGWTQSTTTTAVEAGRQMRELGVETLIYTDIGRDGMLGDPDVEGAVQLARQTGCAVVVSGGVSALGNISAVASHPERDLIDGIIVGRALYEQRFTVSEALAMLKDGTPC